MNPTITIAPKGPGFAVSIPIEAVRLKTEALAVANAVKRVTTIDEQKTAIAAVARLKGLSSGVEKAREEAKAPYWNAGKAIDAKAKEYAKELDETASAIERLIAEFQRQERAKAEAERQRQEKEKRDAEEAVERERRRAEQAERERELAKEQAAEAERKRVQAELDAAEAVGKKAKAAAAAELAKAAAAAKAAEQASKAAEQAALQAEIDASEAEETANDTNVIVYTPDTTKVTGATVREVLEFEVINMDAFAVWDMERRARENNMRKLHPEVRFPLSKSFVKIEVNRRDFKEYVNALSEVELDGIPGVTFSRSTKAAVRSSASDFSNLPHFPGELPQ